MAAIDLAKQVGTTKGDLYVYNGSTLVRLPVGSDGQVLKAASGQAAGVQWAAESGGGGTAGMVEIATAIPSTGTITFSSIPSTYTHLRILARLRTDESAIASIIRLRVGSGTLDTGASSYAYGYYLNRLGTSNMTGIDDAAAEIRQILCPGGSATAGFFGTAVIDIFNYADTAANRQVRMRSEDITGASFGHVGGATGMWLNTTDAIDTVRLFDDTGDNLVSGSKAWLYGIT